MVVAELVPGEMVMAAAEMATAEMPAAEMPAMRHGLEAGDGGVRRRRHRRRHREQPESGEEHAPSARHKARDGANFDMKTTIPE